MRTTVRQRWDNLNPEIAHEMSVGRATVSIFSVSSVMAGALFAQEPRITPETSVNYGILHPWLHSSDPRLIAWAADFARRTHDAKIVAETPELLEHWRSRRSSVTTSRKPHNGEL
jgi:hypothetical protein